MALFAVSLFVLFRFLDTGWQAGPVAGHAVFLSLLFTSGFFMGMELFLANRIYRRQSDYFSFHENNHLKTVGPLCCTSIFGALTGGFLGGFLLIPSMGLLQVCLVLAATKGFIFLLVATLPRK